MKKTEKGYTNVRNYDAYASYNADTERNDATIAFVEQDNSVWVRDKQYSMNAECYVGSNTSGISTTGNWFLCGEATLSAGHDVNIFGSVQQTLSNGALGLFALGLRGDSSTATLKTFQWLSKVGGSIPQLRIVINGFSVKLYCKVFGGQYNYACVRLYQQGGRFGAVTHAKSYFKLTNTDVIIPEADVPSGTDIADVPYITKTDANNKFLPILATTSLVKNNPNVGYIKFAEIDTKGQYGNKAIILSVSTSYTEEPIWNDGLYMINIRGNGASASSCRACCLVQYNLPADNKIKLYYAISGSKVEFYREVRAANKQAQLGFKIISVENFENGKIWDFKLIESSKTTSDATLDTPIGTLTQITRVGHVSYADNTNYATNAGNATNATNSQKVLQTNSVLNKERRVLLGGDNDNTQQDDVCKTHDLTYNPNSNTLTVPTIKNPNGSWVHYADGVAGQSGFVKIATITVLATYVDSPIILVLSQRNIKEPTELAICFNSANSKDPTLNNFSHFSGSVIFGHYIHKSAESTWDVYIKKGQGWDAITVLEHKNPYRDTTHYSITWQNELVTTLPEGYLSSVRALKLTDISGNATTATSATKATQDGNGIVIAGNYQRVYKSSFHVTADGWYKLAFRPQTMGLLDWKDKYILVNVYSRQGGPCNASFKILYSSQGGWMAESNNEFICIPLTTTNYACISNVRLLSKTTGVSGNSYIELYVQLSKGGDNASTDVEITMESNISTLYLYTTTTAGETDTSAYTVITRNAATSAYGGSLAVGGLVAEKALSANKVKQIPTTSTVNRKVLLGGYNDNEEYESTYKTRLLTYNPTKNEFEITDTSSSFILAPTSPYFKLPTASWARGFPLKYGDTSLGTLIGAKGEVSDIEYYYIGGTFTNPDFKFNPATKTMEANASTATTATTADVANKTKYPFILRQDGTNAVSWYAQSTLILDIPSELIKSASSGGITLARANRTFVATATGGNLFTDATGGRVITLQNYATFDITPIEGDILILRIVNSIQAQGTYPLVIPYTSDNTVAKSIALVRGQNSSGWIDWTVSQLSAGIYQFACINKGTSLRWALISNNTFNAP